MAAIASIPLHLPADELWNGFVEVALSWSNAQAVELRDTVVLVPFAQHLELARRAWARRATWLPRIETTRTLARGLCAPELATGSQLRFDVAFDRLTARRLLRDQTWAAAWARQDARAFDEAVASLVATAHAMARAAFAVPPDERATHWNRNRALIARQGGPGSTERTLTQVALEWAAASAAPQTDALFELHPAAWIALQAGGPDVLTSNVLSAAGPGCPCLVVDTDVDPVDPFARLRETQTISVAVCRDFEDEAQRTAAQILADLSDGRHPVALVAQDRLLTRRVRALLERQQVPMQDETGWKLSTTRAGARVAALLRAAHRDASNDDWLDWLKGSEWPGIGEPRRAVRALEVALRRFGWSAPAAVDTAKLDPIAEPLWSASTALVARFRQPRQRGHAAWLRMLSVALDACGGIGLLRSDEAGRQVLAALGLGPSLEPIDNPDDEPMTLDEFAAWVDSALEEGVFVPESPPNAPVVVTPLERAMLRPFAAIVLPSADEKRLGGHATASSPVGESLLQSLGIPTSAERRDFETLAFAQLLRAPKVSLLRRVDDEGEALAPSPLLERLDLALMQRHGSGLAEAADARHTVLLTPVPVSAPLPTAPGLLPARLSASACEALRVCPYRFFALRMLALRDAEELDDEVEKRDFGTWLHEVLQRFQSTRQAPAPAAAEEARLLDIARQVQQERHLEAAAFLPFAATFARLAPRYVEWLHRRDASGARWRGSEVDLRAQPPEWNGVEMHGIIDRIDQVPGPHGPSPELIDYKTGSAEKLRLLVKRPQEDTQLAFYAALMSGQADAGPTMSALYLPLDEREAIKPIEHPDVERTAERLVRGIGAELRRIALGAPLPALGEGQACVYCEARGLCRRDQWSAGESGG
jgi:ATP-dependent helicase/nuclease subunit B